MAAPAAGPCAPSIFGISMAAPTWCRRRHRCRCREKSSLAPRFISRTSPRHPGPRIHRKLRVSVLFLALEIRLDPLIPIKEFSARLSFREAHVATRRLVAADCNDKRAPAKGHSELLRRPVARACGDGAGRADRSLPGFA